MPQALLWFHQVQDLDPSPVIFDVEQVESWAGVWELWDDSDYLRWHRVSGLLRLEWSRPKLPQDWKAWLIEYFSLPRLRPANYPTPYPDLIVAWQKQPDSQIKIAVGRTTLEEKDYLLPDWM